eukprot:1322658-Amphidinium_carterae.1
MNPVRSDRDADVAYVVKKARKINPCISAGMKIQLAESVESVSSTTSLSSVVREWQTTSNHLLHQDSRTFLI